MPEYAGFSISLTSQYDAATIPEHHVRVVPTPTLRSLHFDRLNAESPALRQQHPDKRFSDLHLHSKSTTVIETYIPVYRGSQFWICYNCPPPDRDGDKYGEVVRYYYFKLYVSGKCILSWGVGEQDGWKGKTIFGLFDGGRDFEGRRIVEKRGLFYPGADASDAEGFEIRIFRAKARRREQVRYQVVNEVAGEASALDLTSIGKVQRGERQKLYSFALLDAKNEPWVTFRYRFDTGEDDITRVESTYFSTELEDTTASVDTVIPDVEESQAEDATDSSVWSGLEQNTPPQQPSTVHSDGRRTTRRLSFPPRNALFPSTSRAEPSSPIKQQASASDDDLTRPQTQRMRYSSIAMAEGTFSRRTTGLRKPERNAVRAASPSEQMGSRDGHATSGSSGLLKSVVASALRRRGERSR